MRPNHTPEDLAVFRIHQARVCLQSAMATADFQTAANRSYYCIFHSMRAVQALDRFDSRKHSGVIDNFRKDYIKTEIFPHNFSGIIGNAFEIRLECDYEDFYLVSKKEVAALRSKTPKYS
jgi:uncharacterized protein (UPF0332 family)